ncbi:MAG TPA: DNA translocase FtsK [Gammaproteobacteria bacterium]|nr:DNA translocase FtsK [Gammaproteobacteria bacterium]
MAQASIKKKGNPLSRQLVRVLREGALVLFGAMAFYLLASLVSYHPADPGWSRSSAMSGIHNLGGVAGAWFADVALYLFGYLAYLIPALIAYAGWLLFSRRDKDSVLNPQEAGLRLLGFLLTLIGGAGLATLHFSDPLLALPADAGGILGSSVGGWLVGMFSLLGATLFLLALFLTGLPLFTGLSWLWLMDETGARVLTMIDWSREQFRRLRDASEGRRARRQRAQVADSEKRRIAARKPPRIKKPAPQPVTSERRERERQVPLFTTPADEKLPPLALLDQARKSGKALSREALEAISRQVELKLRDFGVEAEVVAVHPGPVITRFELEPAPGVKSSKISNLSKDLARSLSVMSVRVVEVIPGKTTIGLEIPNEQREIVYLSEVLQSEQYEKANSPLAVALGCDISGRPVVADLARMPHLLVAGTTGSGKSVAVNAMILGLLYRATAREVRLIMIDPKMLELSVYEGIPHLLAPVVTDMKEATNALRWCVAEMERRYRLMAALGVRNIGGYNRKVKEALAAGRPIPDPLFNPELEQEPQQLEVLPYIVVIIDELADMMMVVGKKVEELIARLAQKARAAGIHLILATQRPSVDVITGLIKANIPTRIAFQVSSRIDSRTILDQMGAEHLLGHGDMLYLPAGRGAPERVHGAFVSDHEVHKVVEALKKIGKPQYNEAVLAGATEGGDQLPGEAGTAGEGENDPLYDQAVAIVTETRRASISGVQRRLKIGYNRAARLIEEMEAAGIVSPAATNGSREVIAPPPPE